jgi:hypothetical protein
MDDDNGPNDALARFVADSRVTRSEAWKSVERLKEAIALEAIAYEPSRKQSVEPNFLLAGDAIGLAAAIG